MRVTTSKSKNAESFYISKGYVNDKGVSTSVIIRKLGTLKDLLPEHGPTRDDVMVWAKEQARIETLKYKREKEEKQIKLTFHADRPLDYDKQVFYRGGYLFLQSIYYQLQINKICRKLKQKHKFKYDINAILSDMIYARILTIRFLLNGVKSESSGKFKTYREMPWGEVYLRQFDGRCIKRLAFSYGNRPGDFRAIMEHISAIPVKHGDIAYEVEIFPEYKIQMIQKALDV